MFLNTGQKSASGFGFILSTMQSKIRHMLIILYFEGEGVFILKKEDDEESIKVVEPRSCFCCLLFLVFTINTCMVVHNIVGNFCDYNSIIYSLLLSF